MAKFTPLEMFGIVIAAVVVFSALLYLLYKIYKRFKKDRALGEHNNPPGVSVKKPAPHIRLADGRLVV